LNFEFAGAADPMMGSRATPCSAAMAIPNSTTSAPLTFDLTDALLGHIESCRRGHGFGSASEVVRLALQRFDFAACRPQRDQHTQISVRVAVDDRAMLRRLARQKGVSVGELMRLALEALPAKPIAVKSAKAPRPTKTAKAKRSRR
jgi:Arc/MetJ-type ribon-helix-helix transcriptional regulator